MAEDINLVKELNQIKLDTAVFKKEVSNLQNYNNKLDILITKIAETSDRLNTVIVLHDHKIQQHDKDINQLNSELLERRLDFEQQVARVHDKINAMREENFSNREKHHKEILGLLNNISEMQKTLDDRTTKLEMWKWYVVGIATAVGIIMSQIPWTLIFSTL